MTLRWERPLDARNFIVATTCGACELPVSFHLRNQQTSGLQPLQGKGDIEGNIWFVAQQWPKRVSAKSPQHVPFAVAKRFLEGESAFERRSWNAAVAMYRSALDIATKAMPDVPPGQTFYKRLGWLHENHRITPDMKDWADHVRVEGNEALHDEEDYGEADAKTLRLFTEMFLKYVFEMPGEVEAFRNEAGEAVELAET